MLFNSFEFLFVFLPVAFLGAFILFRVGQRLFAVSWLVLCSLSFYAYWNPVHLWVIVVSILVNFIVGNLIAGEQRPAHKRLYLTVGVAFNLGLLGYFKYLDFFGNVFQAVASGEFTEAIASTALPIGISFYTFQQIAFLVDAYRDPAKTRYAPIQYAFFVSFFPQLIAGPIVHHAEVIPQLTHLTRRFRAAGYVTRYFAPGLAILLIGLGKKVILADSFGDFADSAFDGALRDELSFLEAWGGATAYTLQIYFDFSGYSDMAIGLGRLFGIVLPVNFLSPYKARSIIDFWRRWHMTLSRFLRDYLYISLGGNRRGPARRYVNLLTTMVLGGLWHGAGWTFVFWGALHGVLLAVNQGLRALGVWRSPRWIAVPVTLIIVVFTWVPFRAANFDVVTNFYAAMVGAKGIVVPLSYETFVLNTLGPIADLLGMRGAEIYYFDGLQQLIATAVGFAIVLFLPASMALLDDGARRRAMRSPLLPVALGAIASITFLIMLVRTNVTFLYFQF